VSIPKIWPELSRVTEYTGVAYSMTYIFQAGKAEFINSMKDQNESSGLDETGNCADITVLMTY